MDAFLTNDLINTILSLTKPWSVPNSIICNSYKPMTEHKMIISHDVSSGPHKDSWCINTIIEQLKQKKRVVCSVSSPNTCLSIVSAINHAFDNWIKIRYYHGLNHLEEKVQFRCVKLDNHQQNTKIEIESIVQESIYNNHNNHNSNDNDHARTSSNVCDC